MGVFKRTRKHKNGKETDYWYIRYSVNKVIRWEAVGKIPTVTKDIANTLLAERKKQIRLGQLNMHRANIPTLREFSSEFVSHQRDIKQNRSWKKDEAHIKRFIQAFGNKKLTEITIVDIDNYKRKRVKEVKEATVNRELSALRKLLNLAKKRKLYHGDNIVSESGLFKSESQRMRVLNEEEEHRLLNCSSPHLIPIIKMALLTGMRLSEILTLQWTDVNLDTNLITIRAEISKSKKSRRIPISGSLRKLLLEQKMKNYQSGHVFVTHLGVPYSPNNPSALKRAFTTARRKAQIEDFRFHDLRHTAATRMAENGASIIAVKEILGHADIRTTMKYFHPGDSLTKAVEILANFN